MSASAGVAAAHMDRIYRVQRHFYDATRRHFLLGRDTLIAGLTPPDDGVVVEIGCGTARNLIQAARAYPKARFFGFDVSPAMLETARANVARAELANRIHLAEGDASRFDLTSMFGVPSADRIFVSYALSMIPPWRQVLEQAISQLAPSGSLHVVDFGQLEGYPAVLKGALEAWLARFSVLPCAELERELRHLAVTRNLDPFVASVHRGYAIYAALKRH